MNLRKRCLPVFLAAGLFPMAAAHAGANIVIVNADIGSGQGFEDATPVAPVGGNPGTTRGEQALIAFQFAADLLGATLESDVDILTRATFGPMNCTATGAVLGGASTNYIFAFNPGPTLPEGAVADTWYHSALADALAGEDLGVPNDLPPDTPDILTQFNGNLGNPGCLTGSGWYFGLDGNAPGNLIDFVDTVVHEIAHGLGFSGFNTLSSGAMLQGLPDIYSSFVIDNSNGLRWIEMTNAQRQAAARNDGRLVFTGATVKSEVAAAGLTAGFDGDGNVQLYAPTTLAQGSSFSHYDTRLTPNAVMEPFATGDTISALSLDLTLPLFADLGWGVVRSSQFILSCDTGVPASAEGGPVIGANIYGRARAFAGRAASLEVYRGQIRGHVEDLADDGLLTPAQYDSAIACFDDEQTALQFEEWGDEDGDPGPGPGPGDAIALVNKVPLTGQSGTAGSETLYSIEIPAGVSGPLSISTSGGSGNVSLYVSLDEEPNAGSAGWSSVRPGNNEAVRINNPAAGVYYIKLVGTAAYNNVTVQARFEAPDNGGPDPGGNVLENGVPVTDISGAAGSQQFWTFEVPANAGPLSIAMSGGTGDADLYVRIGAEPTLNVFDCRPYAPGNNESCTASTPVPGTYHIMIHGYEAFAGVSLVATYVTAQSTPPRRNGL